MIDLSVAAFMFFSIKLEVFFFLKFEHFFVVSDCIKASSMYVVSCLLSNVHYFVFLCCNKEVVCRDLN